MNTQKATPETVARRVSSVRSWVSYCYEHNLLDWTLKAKRPKTTPYDKLRPTPWPDVEAAMKTADVRARLIAQLLGLLALRVSSIAALDCEGVVLKAPKKVNAEGNLTPWGEVVVWAKGDKRVVMPIPKRLYDAMVAYEVEYTPRKREVGKGGKHPYVLNAKGKRMSISGITQFCAELGLGTPHQVRHAAAQRLYAQGASPWEIQKLLGHKNVATTQIYLEMLQQNIGPFMLAGEYEKEGKRP